MKYINTLATLILVLTFSSFFYFLFLIYQPFKPPTVTSPIPILNKDKTIHDGESINTKLDYCIYKKVPSTTTTRYEQIGGYRRVYFLATAESAGMKPGCGSVTSNKGTIPIDIPPGRYKIILTSTFRVNALKEVTVQYETEQFTITK